MLTAYTYRAQKGGSQITLLLVRSAEAILSSQQILYAVRAAVWTESAQMASS
jgi:hypothetical protein